MNQHSAFNNLVVNLNLDPAELGSSRKLFSEVVGYFKSRGLVVDAFIQGSLARKTMLPPLHDIDAVVILPAALKASLRWDSGGPDRVMDQLQEALTQRYPGSQFERKKHALQVTFPGFSFHFDIVPAFEIDNDRTGDVLIANREGQTVEAHWTRSNTRELIRVIAERNVRCDGNFIHWTRMGKAMIVEAKVVGFPGLHNESICYAVNTEPADHAIACLRLFQGGAQMIVGQYTDPTGVDALHHRLDPYTRSSALQAFRTAAGLASQAVELAAVGDDAGACALWHMIFGDAFPVSVMQTASDALRTAFSGGSITMAGTVSPTQVGRQVSRPSRSWAP